MVERAVHPTKPSLTKSLSKNRSKMDDVYEELYHAFKLYRREELNTLSEADFNEVKDDGAPVNEYNDAWFA